MAVSNTILIPAKTAENSQTTQYSTAAATKAIIDKLTATNYSATSATISINLVSSGGSAGNDNLIVKTKALQPGETYTFPEIVGHMLTPGQFISTIASVAAAINIRASGREIT